MNKRDFYPPVPTWLTVIGVIGMCLVAIAILHALFIYRHPIWTWITTYPTWTTFIVGCLLFLFAMTWPVD
jgi:hypothetical protein